MPNQEIKTRIIQGLRNKSNKDLLDIYLFCPILETAILRELITQMDGNRTYLTVKEEYLVGFTAYPELEPVKSQVAEFDFKDTDKFVTSRALVVDGDWAGWLGFVTDGEKGKLVRLQRPLSKSGVHAWPHQAHWILEKQTGIEEKNKQALLRKLNGQTVSFPSIIAFLLKTNGFNVDEKRFMSNINQFNLVQPYA
ncbi:MAG: hypothetical protein V1810_02220 [Candidatus Beckwithbacteria bacterium]